MSDQAEKKKTDLLGRIDQFRADWEALLEEVGEARFERPGTAGDWTFRDVVAHLNGWRERTLLRLEAAHEGRDPAPPPWPSHLDDDTDDEVDAINAWLYARAARRSSEDVVAESRVQLARMRELVAAIPAQDLFTPDRYPWLGAHAIADVAIGSLSHFCEEHVPGIRVWLAESR